MPPKLTGAGGAKPAAKKKIGALHKLPDPIKEGEIVRDIQKRQWRLGKSIGVGGFGEIYAASDNIDKPVNTADAQYVIKIEPHSNGPLFVEMNFYIRVAKPDLIEEWSKKKKLKFLGMPRFIGSGSHEYKKEKYRFMIMQRFGSDVQKLFEASQRRFPLNTVINLSLRIIDVLEYIHEQQYIHADIKGSNLLLGFGKGCENQVWLVDFGLACRYIVGGVHKEYKPDLRKAHNGTIEFTSRDAHIGANGRRGDFEILGYNVLQWLTGRLPWEDNLTSPEYVAGEKNKYMADVKKLVKVCYAATTPPAVIVRFMEMVAALKFEERPDYDKFRQVLRQGLKDNGYADDGILVFPCLKTSKATPMAKPSPAKKRSAPSASSSAAAAAVSPKEEEVENEVHKRVKPSIKKSREPCSPKVTNQRATRRVNVTPDSSSSDSTGTKRKAKKKSDTNLLPPASLDSSLNNPTPAMLAILARMRSKQQSPPPAPPAKKKTARLDSRSCSPIDLDTSSILTPAMEEVIRVREVRKSMEQSGYFFTPACSPATTESTSVPRFLINGMPSSTPRNDPYLTLDVSSSLSSPEEDEDSPVRKKRSTKPKEATAAVTPSSMNRVLRNRIHQDSSTSLDSSAVAELSATPEGIQRRIVPKRKYKVITVASASTQTSPGVLNLPSLQHSSRGPYALRSALQSPHTPTGKLRVPPAVIELSPDMFESSGGSP